MAIRELLRLLRPDRQLLLFSATWPQEAEKAANDLCGAELVKIRVNPSVPSIPQEVKLFPGAFDGGFEKKMAELTSFLQDLKEEESVLLFCGSVRSVPLIAGNVSLREALRAQVAVLDHERRFEEQREQYVSFVRRKAKMLVTTFALAGRGLDFQEKGNAEPWKRN